MRARGEQGAFAAIVESSDDAMISITDEGRHGILFTDGIFEVEDRTRNNTARTGYRSGPPAR